MSFEKPINENYAAHVIEVRNVEPIKGKDRIVTLHADGYAAIVSKDVQPGSIGVLFSPETQLSDLYASNNNLYRHTDRNVDSTQSGYLEDNRRVKAIKFAGARSDALFMPLESFAVFGVDPSEFKVGDLFDKLNGSEVCRKYVLKEPTQRPAKQMKFRVLDEKSFPQHYDTDNFFRVRDQYYGNEDIVVTQKLHGTSIRFGSVPVKTELRWHEKLAEKLGVRVAQSEPGFVAGSRRVVKSIRRGRVGIPLGSGSGDLERKQGVHFYGDDIYSEVAVRYALDIPADHIVYGELVGYTPTGSAIQRDYTYQAAPGEVDLYVYRVAVVVGTSTIIDFSWDQVKYFCEDHGLKYVPELFRGKLQDFVAEDWLDRRYSIDFKNAVSLSKSGTVDEGVVVRLEERTPRFMKAKSPAFLLHETKLLDEGVEDLESEQ